MIRMRDALLLGCILCCSTGVRAASADQFAYAWPVQTQGSGSAWQVELNPEVYAAVVNADLRDVAVVNADGETVPAALYRPLAAAAVLHDDLLTLPTFTVPAPIRAPGGQVPNEAIRLQIERGSDGKLRRVDADLGASAAAPTIADARHDLLVDASTVRVPLAALRIDWQAGHGDVTAQFAIDASDDLQQWRALQSRATVMHLTQSGNVLERHEIGLNGARAAYLRVHRLDDGPELPGMTVQARTVASSTSAQSARQWLNAASDGADTKRLDASLPPGDGQRPIAWRYHLPAPLSIEAIRLELADDNSLARVLVLSRVHPGEDAAAWARRANLVAFRLRQGDDVTSNDEAFVTPAARAQDWRVEAATPLDRAPVLSVAFTPDRFVFLAEGTGPYRLVAGSAKARRGDYPIDAAIASLRASKGHDWQPPLATLGARATVQGDSALTAPAVEKKFDWKTWLLWAVLVGAAALIGGLALSLLKNRDEGRGARGE